MSELSNPYYRPRRLRCSPIVREMVSNVELNLKDFIMPIFVRSGANERKPISSMPGISQLSPELAADYVEELVEKGISSFIYFGIIPREEKDAEGTRSYQSDNPVNQAMTLVKKRGLKTINIADVCFCEWTSHGHCGILSGNPEETIDNDETLKGLVRQSITFAQNGADMIAPSCMIDGMVKAIRTGLDQNGFSAVPIMSYSTKFSSNLYGPFREAAEGAPQFGDRRSYQMDFRRSDEWKTEVDLDIEEGADIIMVKPAGFYLDIISRIRQTTSLPIAAYQISGEYSLIHAGAEKGFLDLSKTALESLYAIKRAGAKIIISYFAKDLSDWGVR